MIQAKLVEGTSNYYISKCGKLFSTSGKRLKRLKVQINPDGYEKCTIFKNGKRKDSSIHRLIGLTWIRRPPGKTQINHKNGIKTDNRIENLEWVTLQENNAHAISVLGVRRGDVCTNSKITSKDVLWIRSQRKLGKTYEWIGKHFGLKISQTKRICDGESWAHVK